LRNARPEGGPPAYVCRCSREQARKDSAARGTPGLYAGTCRGAGIPWSASAFPGDGGAAESAGLPVRALVPRDAAVSLRTFEDAPLELHPGREMGDFVVWQKAGLPSYQLASVVDDESLGIDCVVRGADLLPSTGAQAWLAERIGAPGFRAAVFLHHALLLDPEGGKLSKSAGAESLRAFRERGGPGPLLRGFAAWMGIEPGGVASARDLVPHFDPRRLPRADRPWPDFASGLL
jgi:glutamyl-tRNA synthetase